MAGHSKWANIKHRKERMDAKRSKTFSKLVREITAATKISGSDLSANPRLRLAVDKAKASNVAADNIERAIKRGTGEDSAGSAQEMRYEGYAIAGTAIIIDCLSDNRNRTLSEVRHTLQKSGGNLGTDGSVTYLFIHCGELRFNLATLEDFDQLENIAIEHGATDIVKEMDENEEQQVVVLTELDNYALLHKHFSDANLTPDDSQITMRATTSIELTLSQSEKMLKLLNVLEDLEDTQEIFHNAKLVYPSDIE